MFTTTEYQNITIEPFGVEHEPFYMKLREFVKADDQEHVHPANSEIAFVALADRVPAGMIFTYHRPFHPYCTYISLLVLPSSDRMQIASRLLMSLSAHRMVYPLQISVWDTDFAMKQALIKQGFYEIRNTYHVHIATSQCGFIRDEEYVMNRRSDYELLSLSEFLERGQGEEELVHLVKKTYEHTHRANPPGVFDLSRWKAFLHGQDLDSQGSYVALNAANGHCAGFALLHLVSEDGVAELGWRGAASSEPLDLILLLTKEQMTYAADNRIKQLTCEVDSTDPYQMELLHVYPFEPAPAWVTYHKQR
ncbi:hypothetical protein QPK24_10110 [Paenibacillus polygoni]|uniref:N-acetyltransferase domain-containing protein n=1 Tax=Paenibacillus polygoni TaxID=3050112 RepID=A0ABY8X785_9BACL|nr:hypothetical protein [Paenibacillus polygoni]WIV20989.1 hypothetical protein QPK24_10110 [Paenibacillus polygoni]